MKDWTEIRERYLRDQLPIRLGGLAANLARVSSFSKNPNNQTAVEGLIEESKYFIEWTAPEAEISTAAELVELQIQLARWQLTLEKTWSDFAQRTEMVERSRAWSDRILDLSGLLNK